MDPRGESGAGPHATAATAVETLRAGTSPDVVEGVRRLVRMELADVGQAELLDEFTVEPADPTRGSTLADAIAHCVQENPDFEASLVAALAPAAPAAPPIAVVPLPREPPVAMDGSAYRWITRSEVRRQWPMVRESCVPRVAAELGVIRWFRQTGPPRQRISVYSETPGELLFDADGVARVAQGLASGEISIRPEQRLDTPEGRSAHRRQLLIGGIVVTVVVVLVGVLCAGVLSRLLHPHAGGRGTDCGDCGWH